MLSGRYSAGMTLSTIPATPFTPQTKPGLPNGPRTIKRRSAVVWSFATGRGVGTGPGTQISPIAGDGRPRVKPKYIHWSPGFPWM